MARRSTAPDRVASVMQRRYVAVAPNERMGEARELMRLARVRHLLVLEGGVLVGLVSYRDLLEARLASELAGAGPSPGAPDADDEPVSAHMRAGPVTILTTASLREAAGCMLRLRLGCLPVVENGSGAPRPVGIVAESDLLRAAYAVRSGAR